jgi:hypothetical protein
MIRNDRIYRNAAGYTPLEMLRLSAFDLVHPDEREALLEAT